MEKDEKKYFVIRDVCNILGFRNPNRQLSIHTENKPLYERIRTPGGLQIVRLVPREDVDALLAALPDDARMLWTGGFFDDAYICVSRLAKTPGTDRDPSANG